LSISVLTLVTIKLPVCNQYDQHAAKINRSTGKEFILLQDLIFTKMLLEECFDIDKNDVS
jgi:hypothetical protein